MDWDWPTPRAGSPLPFATVTERAVQVFVMLVSLVWMLRGASYIFRHCHPWVSSHGSSLIASLLRLQKLSLKAIQGVGQRLVRHRFGPQLGAGLHSPRHRLMVVGLVFSGWPDDRRNRAGSRASGPYGRGPSASRRLCSIPACTSICSGRSAA